MASRNIFVQSASVDYVLNTKTKIDDEILEKINYIGVDASNSYEQLKTTPKTQIIENRIKLPSKPEGDLLFGMMKVYLNDIDNTCDDYDGVTIALVAGEYFAQLNETQEITGYGVVSYITKREL